MNYGERDMATQISDEEFDRQYDAAVKLGAERENTEPKAVVASYNLKQNELTLRLANGATFTFPCDLLPEFKDASPDDIAAVEVRPHGSALHWEKLDQDFTVGGLIASVFADKVLMAEMGRRGGRVQSTAKALAARENGRKGGRPLRQGSGLTVTAVSAPAKSFFTDMLVANVAAYDFSPEDWVKFEEMLTQNQSSPNRETAECDVSGRLLSSPDFMVEVLAGVRGLYKSPDFQVSANAEDATINEELAVAA